MGATPEFGTIDDQDLVLRTKAGDRSAFEVLVRKYQDRAYNVAFQILRHHEDALDVAQEAFRWTILVRRTLVAGMSAAAAYHGWLGTDGEVGQRRMRWLPSPPQKLFGDLSSRRRLAQRKCYPSAFITMQSACS